MNAEPGSPSWDEDKLLISAISMANPVLGRYALQLIDVDAGRALDWSIQAERELGQQINAIGAQILHRAQTREQGVPGPARQALPPGGRTDHQN